MNGTHSGILIKVVDHEIKISKEGLWLLTDIQMIYSLIDHTAENEPHTEQMTSRNVSIFYNGKSFAGVLYTTSLLIIYH